MPSDGITITPCPNCGHGSCRAMFPISHEFRASAGVSYTQHDSLRLQCAKCGHVWEQRRDAPAPDARVATPDEALEVNTYTAAMWIILDDDGKWAEYVRCRSVIRAQQATLEQMREALRAAEGRLTTTHGCVCGCPVLEGHTGVCPITAAITLADAMLGDATKPERE